MHAPQRITLATLRQMKAAGEKIAMLTAYDFPLAVAAQAAGAHALLIGDSMGTVLLGHPTTRLTPLSLMLTLGEAVRRGAPQAYLVGDLPFESLRAGPAAAAEAARRFRDEAGCDASKAEVGPADVPIIAALVAAGIETVAHLGLLPQQVTTPEGYRAQARDAAGVATLVAAARAVVAAGAGMLVLEAVPREAAAEVVAAVDVPVIGCGAGPACDGHVLVTQDMLGWGTARPPRFVPVHADLNGVIAAALRRYVEDVTTGRYPASEHAYAMKPAERSVTKP